MLERSALLRLALVTAALNVLAASVPVRAQVLLRDIAAPTSQGNGAPTAIVGLPGVANVVIFAARSEFGVEPWRSDGTTAGTWMLRDIAPGIDSSFAADMFAAGAFVFFTAQVDGIGRELWRTDGTAAGTILLGDLNVGTASSSPTTFVEWNGELWFRATSSGVGAELWRSDGTLAGTRLAVDVPPSTRGSSRRAPTSSGS